MWLFIYLFVYLLMWLFIYLFIYLLINLFGYSFIHSSPPQQEYMIPELPGPSVDKGKGSPFRPTLKKMGGGRSNTSTPTKFLGELDPDFQPFDKPFIGRLHMLKYTECQLKETSLLSTLIDSNKY